MTATRDFRVRPTYLGSNLIASGDTVGLAGSDTYGNGRVPTVDQQGGFDVMYVYDRRLGSVMTELLFEQRRTNELLERLAGG